MSYQEKYLKYKTKYLDLKTLVGGSTNNNGGGGSSSSSSSSSSGSTINNSGESGHGASSSSSSNGESGEGASNISSSGPREIIIKKFDELQITQTISECIKELIVNSYEIYNNLLIKARATNKPISIICGGQSPSYYCLAMMNFSIFNEHLVNIIVLPHSKHGERTSDQYQENIKYCERLKEKNIILNDNVVIIDGVHSGVGILALESALKHCYRNIEVTKIAINTDYGINKIYVDQVYALPCEAVFSDAFPRLVMPFYPREFNNRTISFITEFINIHDNPIAEMIIDIAKNFPSIQVEHNEWFILNNQINSTKRAIRDRLIEREREIEAKRIEREAERERKIEAKRIEREAESSIINQVRERREQIEKDKGNVTETHYTPIVLSNSTRNKIYQCPICLANSGTSAPEEPTNFSFFSHYNHPIECVNQNKIPLEK